MPALTDQSRDHAVLLDRIRAGSPEALGELYTRYAEVVYHLAYRLTASLEDAEDVLQDVFLGLPRALEGYREQGRFESWLKRVAARTALMRLRSDRRRRTDPMDIIETLPAPEAGPVIDRIEFRRVLREMPESLRVVFMLKEIEGYSHAEIADLLRISSGASAARLSRAWTFLRKEVGHS
jgi:RNA polymerase sigma-70 factor (ECF subfamily)